MTMLGRPRTTGIRVRGLTTRARLRDRTRVATAKVVKPCVERVDLKQRFSATPATATDQRRVAWALPRIILLPQLQSHR